MLDNRGPELEKIIQNKQKLDLEVNQFATISGIKGNQFNREIYVSLIPFKDLMAFLDVFPDVQRDVIPRRVKSIKHYVLTGIEQQSDDVMRFFSAVTATCRGNLFYSEDSRQIAIDSSQSKLSINDGQHRFYGISEALVELKKKIDSSKDKRLREFYRKNLEQLEQMVMPLVLYNEISETEEKQLFHDLNNLAQRPSRSATIKLAQTDIHSKLARELSMQNRYLTHYGVEMDKMSIHSNNQNTILLTTVYQCVKELYPKATSKNVDGFSERLLHADYKKEKKETNHLFDELFRRLPHDINQKGKYLIEKSYTLRGIFRFIHEQIHVNKHPEELVFDTINEIDFSTDYDYWKKHGATLSKKGHVIFTSESGRNAIQDALNKQFEKALKKK